MLESFSRYAGLDVGTATVPDGEGGRRTVRFLRRRFPPQPGALATQAEHVVSGGDRLDTIAARHFGDPTGFWLICDANPCVHPDELTAGDRIGEVLRVPVPHVPQG
ncbi:LysM domain-containing protein [Streptomyces sp. NPDC021093]|uniref:LysM domain-containing protein n=1 Tax=Streptomyces sp. NPDC021093 TaxID=3365112 RepID=UPI0037890C96